MLDELRKYSRREATWSFAGNGMVNIVQALVTLVLARILTPHDFGLMATAMLPIVIARGVIWRSFGAPVTQRATLPKGLLETLFYSACIAGIFVGGTMLLLTYAVTPWVQNVTLLSVFRWTTPIYLLLASATIPQALLLRNLQAQARSIIALLSMTIGGVVAVIFAFYDAGVYSLVWQQTVVFGVLAVLNFYHTKWWPTDRPRIAHLHENKTLITTEAIDKLVQFYALRIDQLVVSVFLGISALGYYDIALRITQALFGIVRITIFDIAFPIFGKVQGDIAKGVALLRHAIEALSCSIIPLCIGVFLYANVLVSTLFGPQWEDSVPIVRIFALYYAADAFAILWNRFLVSSGKPITAIRIEFLKAVLVTAGVIIGSTFGLSGVAYAITVIAILIQVPYLHRLSAYTKLSWYIVFGPVWISSIPAIGMIAMFYILKTPESIAGYIAHATVVLMTYITLLAALLRMRNKDNMLL